MAKRTIRLYLILGGMQAFGIAFFSATYSLFLLSQGLNLFEMNLVNAAFMATLLIAEIPTGAVADTWGRKVSYVASVLFYSISMFAYASAHSFWTCVLAEVIGAIGATLATGAFDAWLVDTLHYDQWAGSLEDVFVRSSQVRQTSMIGGMLIGAYLGGIHLSLPWIGAGVVMLGLGCVAITFMRDPSFERRSLTIRSGFRSMGETIGKSIRYSRGHGDVRFILAFGAVLYVAVQGPNMFWQPHFLAYVGDRALLGWFGAAIMLMLMAGATLAQGFLRHVGGNERRALLLAQATIGMCVFLSGWFAWPGAVVSFFLLHEIGRGMYGPLCDAYLNRAIPSMERATLLSFEAMACEIGALVGLLASGAVATRTSIPVAWMAAGVLLLLAVTIGFTKVWKR